MAFSNSSEPIVDVISDRLLAFCEKRGLRPIPLIEGATLLFGWAGLTWMAFIVSLLVVEVGERNHLSLIDGAIGGCLIGLGQWCMLRPHLQRAYRWIVVSALIWGALALLHIGAIGWMAPDTPDLLVRGISGLFYGGYVGLILGVGQWWIMRRDVAWAWRWVPLNAGIWGVAIAFGWLIGGGLRAASNLFVSEVVGLMVAWAAISVLSGIGIVGMLYQNPPSTDR